MRLLWRANNRPPDPMIATPTAMAMPSQSRLDPPDDSLPVIGSATGRTTGVGVGVGVGVSVTARATGVGVGVSVGVAVDVAVGVAVDVGVGVAVAVGVAVGVGVGVPGTPGTSWQRLSKPMPPLSLLWMEIPATSATLPSRTNP